MTFDITLFDQGTITQNVYKSKMQIWLNHILFLTEKYWSIWAKILHMSRQQSCRDTCKILAQMDFQYLNWNQM